MNDSSKVLNLILAQQTIHGNDILFALSKVGITPADIMKECGVQKSTVSLVVHGKRRSKDVATFIAAKLNTTTRRLWGDAYDDTPKTEIPNTPQAATA